MKTYFLLFLVFVSMIGFAQTSTTRTLPDTGRTQVHGKDTSSERIEYITTIDSVAAYTEIFTFADVMPVFPDDKYGFQKYLADNFHYPEAEKEANMQGTVYISFVIEKDGRVTNVKAVKEVPGAPGFTKEGIRIFKGMPNWSPGERDGKKVRVEITQPVHFVLIQDSQDKKGKNKKKKH